jgi:hypothetical protein
MQQPNRTINEPMGPPPVWDFIGNSLALLLVIAPAKIFLQPNIETDKRYRALHAWSVESRKRSSSMDGARHGAGGKGMNRWIGWSKMDFTS